MTKVSIKKKDTGFWTAYQYQVPAVHPEKIVDFFRKNLFGTVLQSSNEKNH